MDANAEEAYEFVDTVIGGVVPKESTVPIDEDIQEAIRSGILNDYLVLDVKATVYNGSYHEVDPSETVFRIAGSLALRDAVQKGGAVLLEPITKVEVTIPEDCMGFIVGDIDSHRGRVEGFKDIFGGKMIKVFVPLSEMLGYSTNLRSDTQGRGNYSMFLEKYKPAPENVADKILPDKK